MAPKLQAPRSGRQLFQGVRDPRRRSRRAATEATQQRPAAKRRARAAARATSGKPIKPRHRGGRSGRARQRDLQGGKGVKRPPNPNNLPLGKRRATTGPPAAFARPIGQAVREDDTVEVEIGDTELAEMGEQVYTGVIKNLSKVKGLGFIVSREAKQLFGRDVIVTPEHLKHFAVGDYVDFSVFTGEDGLPYGYALASHEVPAVGAPVDTSVVSPRTPERRRPAPKPSLAPKYSSPPQRPQPEPATRPRTNQVRSLIRSTGPAEASTGSAGLENGASGSSQGGTQRKGPVRYRPPISKAKQVSAPAKPFTAFGPASTSEAPKAAPPEEPPKQRSFQELFEKAKNQMKQLEARRGGELRQTEAVAPPSVKAAAPMPTLPKAPAPMPTLPKATTPTLTPQKGRMVLPPSRAAGASAKPLPKPSVPIETLPTPDPTMEMAQEAVSEELDQVSDGPPDLGQPKAAARGKASMPPPLSLPRPRVKAPAAPSISRSRRAAVEALPLAAGEEVLLLDIVPSSALLVESLCESILARPGIRQMNFAQPAGDPTVSWRAEIIGSSGALEEVEIFLENTLEHGSMVVAGYEAGPGSSVKVAEGSCRVAVQGFQDAFGQGGSCAALMACGHVLQWTRAGSVAYCWLASPEAVWIAHQFLHRPPSLILPDDAAQRAVARWRERRRQEFAQLQGSYQLPEDEELDRLLMEDPAVKAAKARLAEFFRLLAEDEGYEVDSPQDRMNSAATARPAQPTPGSHQQGYPSWQQRS